MGQWATADDVLDRWVGKDRPTDLALVGKKVDDAETVIAARFPGIADRIASGDLDVSRVQLVVANMVTRHIRNPEGVRSRQGTTGPFQGGITFGGDNPGEMSLTDAEVDMLTPGGSGSQRAFTIDTTPPRPEPDPWWVLP